MIEHSVSKGADATGINREGNDGGHGERPVQRTERIRRRLRRSKAGRGTTRCGAR